MKNAYGIFGVYLIKKYRLNSAYMLDIWKDDIKIIKIAGYGQNAASYA